MPENKKSDSHNGLELPDMNDEELARFITEKLSDSLIIKYSFEEIKTTDGKTITKFSMTSSHGWKIENEDIWEE